MKKILALSLTLILFLTVATGCAKTEPSETELPTKNQTDTPANSDDYIKSYDKEEFFPIGDSETEGFLLKGKKYEYYGNDVLILKVESKTDTAYSIKMRVTYYDESGEKIRSTNKSFEGFAAGWENYFVFQPNTSFTSFDYELNTNEFTGTAYSGFINTKECGGAVQGELYNSLLWANPYGQQEQIGDPSNRRVSIIIKSNLSAMNEETLYYAPEIIVFDNKGDLYYLNTINAASMLSPDGGGEFTTVIYASDTLWKEKDKFVWPEELTGDIYCIFGFEAVDVKPLV